jgi:hypothetical protein
VRKGGYVDVVLFACLVGVWIGCEGKEWMGSRQEVNESESEVRSNASQAFANEEESPPSGKSAIGTEVL